MKEERKPCLFEKKIHITKKVILQRGIQWNFELIEYES